MSETRQTALLVEDEAQIRRFVRSALEEAGWQVHEAENMKRGLIDAATRKPDLIVLDLGLPDGDGVDFIRELRTWSEVALIVLSARSHENDKIRALDAGADDYLSKPFGVGELLARVRSAMRRRRNHPHEAQQVLRFGDVCLDLQARLVTRAAQVVHLTPTEYRVLAVLAINAGRVMTTPQILRAIWGPGHAEDGHYLRVYIWNLRQKLEQEPAQPRFLLTETGIGYRLLV